MSQSNEFCTFFFRQKLSEKESEVQGVDRAASLLPAFKTIVTTSVGVNPK